MGPTLGSVIGPQPTGRAPFESNSNNDKSITYAEVAWKVAYYDRRVAGHAAAEPSALALVEQQTSKACGKSIARKWKG